MHVTQGPSGIAVLVLPQTSESFGISEANLLVGFAYVLSRSYVSQTGRVVPLFW
jgi:hypothetical protein